MERMKKKIQSQSGASFLFALLAFLVAAMVSVTIVAAAVTTVKRVHGDRESQQAQLTLISAAQLVRNEMEKTKYIFTTTITETTTINEDNTVDTSTTVREEESAEGPFEAEIEDAVKYVKNGDPLAPYKADPAFRIEVTESGFKMRPVDVSFDMKVGEEKYYLVFTLSIEGTGETLFLKMPGSGPNQYGNPITTTSEDGSTTTTVSKTAITWSNGVIDGAGS